MTIRVEVPGLDTILPEISDAQIVVVESGADSAKSFFVRRLGITAMRAGMAVTFVISRDKAELISLLNKEGGAVTPRDDLEILEQDSIQDVTPPASKGGLLAIDSFSFLTLDIPPSVLAAMLRTLRAQCRAMGTTVILATDRGMFEPRGEAVVNHLADGLLQFHSREGPEGLVISAHSEVERREVLRPEHLL